MYIGLVTERGDSMDDWRAEYRVEAEATEYLEKTLGVTDSLLAAVEVKDTHEPLIMTSSRPGYSMGVEARVSLAAAPATAGRLETGT
jgi:hypothetical protein